MDLNVAITLGIFATVLSLILYKITSRYLTLEHQKTTSEQKATYEKTITDMKDKYVSIENSRDGYRQKLNYLRANADIYFDDDELLDDPTIQQDDLIPAIATALFPKMPKKLTALLGREDFQDALFKIAEKNPEKITDWVGKFFTKREEPQGKTPALQEKYL